MAEDVEINKELKPPFELTDKELAEQTAMRIAGLEMEIKGLKRELEETQRSLDYTTEDLRVALARTELQLNLNNPFERVINEMVQLQRVKSQDYAKNDDILANMKFVVDMLGIPQYTVVEDCNAMVLRKCARIVNLRGKSATNESVRDSYLDRAVYAVLAIVALNGQHKTYLVPESESLDDDYQEPEALDDY